MGLTKTKTKTKTKSLGSAGGSFPASGWQYDMEYVLELPAFFENRAWRDVPLPPPPGPDETWAEIGELMRKQALRLQRQRRREDIEREADAHDPRPIMRLLRMPPGGGATPATYTLMEGLIVLGKIVAVHYKHRFMRARPSQLEPRLRPMIDVPGHPAYPSGHALQMFLVAKALSAVVRNHELGEELFNVAEEIAVNREWAGIHYASDTAAGKELALAIFPQVADAYLESFQKAGREWL